MICSLWRNGLDAQNIISGFRSTGVFPVDKTKYKLSRLDKFKLQSYTAWKLESCVVQVNPHRLQVPAFARQVRVGFGAGRV